VQGFHVPAQVPPHREQKRSRMKIGDLIKLHIGTRNYWELPTGIALLVEKLPRNDRLEYDWKVLADGRYIELGRQLEQSAEVINENR
jgi:hypothetical protein